MPFGLTPTGFNRKTLQEILDELDAIPSDLPVRRNLRHAYADSF